MPCLKCNSDISPEALACPECGYEPESGKIWIGNVMLFAGIALSFTLVGAIFGIPLAIAGLAVKMTADDVKPTQKEPV